MLDREKLRAEFREYLNENGSKYVIFYFSMKSDSDRSRLKELNTQGALEKLYNFNKNVLFDSISAAKNDVKEEIAYVKKSNKYADKSTIAWKKEDLNNKVAHIWSVKEVDNGYNLVKLEAIVNLKW